MIDLREKQPVKTEMFLFRVKLSYCIKEDLLSLWNSVFLDSKVFFLYWSLIYRQAGKRAALTRPEGSKLSNHISRKAQN